MASIVRLGTGKQPPRAIDFSDDSGNRKRIRLGIVSHDEAVEAKRRIKKLLAAKTLNQTPDAETLRWLNGVSDTIHERISRSGLCTPRVPVSAAPSLGDFVAKYLSQRRNELKPASLKRMAESLDRLVAFFGQDQRIDQVNADAARDWRAHLLAHGLAEATVRLHCRNAKTLFGEAVSRELISRNPFAGVKSAAIAANRDRYVTLDEAKRVLAACPSTGWRLLFGLARFAGLRCPSETHRLTWSDVDWERKRLVVFAPKTGRTRLVPILPSLMPLLDAAFDEATDGTTQVVNLSRHNLHRGLAQLPQHFEKIRRAGILLDFFST